MVKDSLNVICKQLHEIHGKIKDNTNRCASTSVDTLSRGDILHGTPSVEYSLQKYILNKFRPFLD